MTAADTPTVRLAKRGDVDETPKTQAELLDDTLSEISKHTSSLYRWLPLIRDIADTHREGMGFVPEATRAAIGRQHTRDRREVRLALAAGGAISAGESPAPGNMTSWGLEADIAMTLRHETRFVLRRMHNPACAELRPTKRSAAPCDCGLVDKKSRGPRENDTTEEIISRFRGVVMEIRVLRLAATVLVDVAHLADTARQILFGEDRTKLGAVCPHCGRPTLVVYLQTGVIACERARDLDRSIPPCKCADRLCPCQNDARFEHQWLRDRPKGHPRSWQTFAGVLKQNTNRKEIPPT